MGKSKIRSIFVIVFISMLFVFSGCGQKTDKNVSANQTAPQENKPVLKVALLLSGPINDNGWNAIAYESLQKVKEGGAQTSYRENVAQSDQLEAFRAYATQGYNIIFAHGYEFTDAAKKVAPEFPQIKFVVTSNNFSQEPNVASIYANTYQAGFFAGMVAGAITKTHQLAYIGAMDIPAVTEPRDGFIAGAKYIDSEAKVTTAFIGSWDDSAKAKEIANALIQKGVDVILPNADQAGLGAIQAAAEKKVYAIGISRDQSQSAPETVVASSKYYYPLEYVANLVKEGKFEARCYRVGIKEDATGLIWNNKLKDKVSAEAMSKINQAIEDVKSGKLDVAKLVEESKK
ncbi:BMP family protein [Moorella naiadis]|uniref:BMP family protein n=1 Tax=Moorella naiadis (nom. illeg.) TaxID=3093670 RepID=UPI003D9C8C0B